MHNTEKNKLHLDLPWNEKLSISPTFDNKANCCSDHCATLVHPWQPQISGADSLGKKDVRFAYGKSTMCHFLSEKSIMESTSEIRGDIDVVDFLLLGVANWLIIIYYRMTPYTMLFKS